MYHVTLGGAAALGALLSTAIIESVLCAVATRLLPPAAPTLLHLESQIHFGMIVDSDNNNLNMVCKRTVVSFPHS